MHLERVMFERIFRNKVKEAEAKYEAKYEAELNKRIAERLKHYNIDGDDSVSNFSEIDFKENSDKTLNITDREGNVDVWGQANPAESTQWNKENRRKSDRRQIARRKLDRQ
jgi:hypothetical protein